MSLYLGSDKLSLAISSFSNADESASGYVTGVAISDSDGVITFPELSFTPTMIAVWNVRQLDLKEQAEANGEDWEDGYVRYVHEGTMLFAIYQDNTWVSQGLTGMSGQVFISNHTRDFGSCVSVDNGIYSYRLSRYPGDSDGANELYHYIICG